MLRAGQSLLAHTMARHYLGKGMSLTHSSKLKALPRQQFFIDWRFPSHSPNPVDVLKQSKVYCDVSRQASALLPSYQLTVNSPTDPLMVP